jgi:NADPH:quinone reductase-like Zn-dependent oxidoreductase
VTRFQAGDEVFGFAKGSFAELARAPERTLAKKPAQLGFEEAAAVPVSPLTALQGLRDHGRLSSGQHVLILGASGGVGSFAVQIAKAHGAEVTGVCSASKLDLVRELGADHALDYAADDFALQPGAYDLVFDIGGNRSLRTLRRALSPRGTLVIVGGEGGDRWTGGVHRQLRAVLWSLFLRPRMSTFVAQPNPQDVQELKELLETGKLRAAVDRSFPLREAADAIRYLESGSVRSLS